jgi:FkbM family methyltransferase
VLANLDCWSSAYRETAYVFVENDSTDDTRAQLEDWLVGKTGELISLDGLDAELPTRTERIARARNAYLDAVRSSALREFDDLVVLDLDEVNSRPTDLESFVAARDYLWAEEQRVAVFANAAPFYYDIWALRHPKWSPDDCWVSVARETPLLGRAAAEKRFVYDRQIALPASAAPVEVDSAFGGLGIYKMPAALASTYIGRNGPSIICEHVTFHETLRRNGGVLTIYPKLSVTTSPEHISGALRPNRKMRLEQSGRRGELYAPPEHSLDKYRAAHPLYDRRLPVLAGLLSNQATGSVIVDVGANIGDTAALCRLAGCTLPIVAIDASLTYCKFLWANALSNPRLLEPVKLVWGFVGSADEEVDVSLAAGTASVSREGVEEGRVERVPTVRLADVVGDLPVSLVKTDTDGHDQTVVRRELGFLRQARPILWLEAQTETHQDELEWGALLEDLSTEWPRIIAFDNFGFAIYAGESRAAAVWITQLMAYSRRQRRLHEKGTGRPTFYYLDIALFPERFSEVFQQFVANVEELGL